MRPVQLAVSIKWRIAVHEDTTKEYSSSYLGASWGVGGQRHAPATLPGKDPVLIVQKAECVLGMVWTGAENSSHRDSIPEPSSL
jgi:hypothetical protein